MAEIWTRHRSNLDFRLELKKPKIYWSNWMNPPIKELNNLTRQTNFAFKLISPLKSINESLVWMPPIQSNLLSMPHYHPAERSLLVLNWIMVPDESWMTFDTKIVSIDFIFISWIYCCNIFSANVFINLFLFGLVNFWFAALFFFLSFESNFFRCRFRN